MLAEEEFARRLFFYCLCFYLALLYVTLAVKRKALRSANIGILQKLLKYHTKKILTSSQTHLAATQAASAQ